jgi:hypothetical protein
MNFEAEYTDTFSGEANYSWVRRALFNVNEGVSDRSLVREAKRRLGLTGVRCYREEIGDMIKLVPVGTCTVLFIYPVE